MPLGSHVYQTQREAIEAGRQSAISNRSELLVHGSNGQIRERNTYGSDRIRRRGKGRRRTPGRVDALFRLGLVV